MPDPDEAKKKFQDNQTVVTSKDTEAGGGLNLAVKRVKPNNAGPLTKSMKIKWNGGNKDKKQSTQGASQVLERGVQRAAEEILTSRDTTVDDIDYINPPGFSDESGEGETSVRRSRRATKGPSRYGDPIKNSVKLIFSQDDIMDLNKAVLEAYHIKLATFKPDTKNSGESKFGLLEKHLFRRKLGSEA